jgi:uncharacterized membrane protein/predicted DsbA family dithiol-disulfide isomerase
MLAVDYLRPAPVFCSEGGGCEALKHTVVAMPFGVPLPLLGLIGFVALGGWALVPGRVARFVQLGLAGGAGVVGVLLLVLQGLLGHFCPYCFAADVCGILSLFFAAWRVRVRTPEPRRELSWTLAGIGLLGTAAALPLVAGFRMNPTPKVIQEEIAKAPPGELTVVDFVDFECPFCRMTNAEIAPVIESHRDRIHLVRKQVPLLMHPHAHDAARAACCGELLGQGDAMAEALFSAEVEDLTPEGCEKIAASLNLPLDQYRACIQSPATDASIEADRSEFKAASGYALPTIWIDETPLIGAQPREAVAKVVHEALAKRGS